MSGGEAASAYYGQTPVLRGPAWHARSAGVVLYRREWRRERFEAMAPTYMDEVLAAAWDPAERCRMLVPFDGDEDAWRAYHQVPMLDAIVEHGGWTTSPTLRYPATDVSLPLARSWSTRVLDAIDAAEPDSLLVFAGTYDPPRLNPRLAERTRSTAVMASCPLPCSVR